MNQELANVLKLYTTKPHKELNDYLIGKSKDNIIGMLVDLITMYINDKNSSTIREFITVTLAGYNHKEGKIGYNVFKQDAFVHGKTLMCEAKPKNCDTNSDNIYKLRGAGNFSDYTFSRLERDSKEDCLNMLVSGFIDGKLIYILEFPFKYENFISILRKQLLKRFPGGKDIPNEYLRSAEFHYKHFIDCPELKIIYLIEKDKLGDYKPYIVRDFYKILEAKTK
ncbi:hypothetical protein ACFLY3_00400 [Chloroflexota bacterium]